jgi:hypothetical protein
MFFPKLFLAASALYPALAAADPCSVTAAGMQLPERQLSRGAPVPPTVDLYVHVIAGSKSRQDGYLSVSHDFGPQRWHRRFNQVYLRW